MSDLWVGRRGTGVDTTGYPAAAVRTLAWDDLYANLYVGTVGVLAAAIGLAARMAVRSSS